METKKIKKSVMLTLDKDVIDFLNKSLLNKSKLVNTLIKQYIFEISTGVIVDYSIEKSKLPANQKKKLIKKYNTNNPKQQ